MLKQVFLVRETGLEPVRVTPHAPQTCASADSATLASTKGIIANEEKNVNTFFNIFRINQRLQYADDRFLCVITYSRRCSIRRRRRRRRKNRGGSTGNLQLYRQSAQQPPARSLDKHR